MKKRKVIAFLMSLLMIFSMYIPQQTVLAANGIEVQFNNGNTGTSSNTINAKFKVVNNGSSSINLSQLKLRYYYTKDADKAQNFYCDYAGMLSGGAHTTMTNKITGTIVNMSKATSTADTYIEVGFTSDAGSLAAGGFIEIQTRVSRSDWSNYDQSNDFSYKSAGSYVVWDQVAAYLNGSLVFGKSPVDDVVPTKDPEISPKSATFNKSAPRNITVTLTPNGNTFNGISGLTRNTHYTVSGNTVTILSSYLSTLTLGTKRLTFDFGVSNNPVLNLTITEDVVQEGLEVSIGNVTGNTGDTVVVPVNFANVAKAGNVGTCNFYIDFDTSLLEAVSVSAGDIVTNPNVNFSSQINVGSISFLFLDDTVGEQPITKDGTFAYITFKVKGAAGKTASLSFKESGAFGNGNMSRITGVKFSSGSVTIKKYVEGGFTVKIDTVNGATGEEVILPINFTDVAKVGNVGTCNFYLSYDKSLLEAVKVEAGSIITNPSVNFASSINSEKGTISLLYLDDTLGDELITKDGVFAYITFKVLGSEGKTASVKFAEGGAFGDGDMVRIDDVNKIDGGVVITSTVNPTISPASATFDKNAPSDIKVTLTPNGSTFKEITGLKKGTDYTVSGNTVTILKSYLSTLSLGSTTLIFDFGVANNPKLTVTIKDSTPSGDELAVSIGTVTAMPNETVTVPVKFANVSKAGNVGTCNFYLSYDSDLLEAVSVTAGDIITNASINFASRINDSTSTISLLFLDNTIGDELITNDGVFANITFKVLGKEGQTAKVEFAEGGAFGDADMNRISNVVFTDGGVKIEAKQEDPEISPTSATFDKYKPEEITVTLTANQNTFKGILGLRANVDYTLSGNTVKIKDSYLSSLPLGKTELTFDFGVDNNPVLTLLIEDSTPASESLAIKVGTVSGEPGETVLVPITVENVNEVGNIGAYSFAVTYDPNLLKALGVTDGEVLADKGIAKKVYDTSDSGISSAKKTASDAMAIPPKYERAIYLSFNAFENKGITEDGVLAYIEFEILGKAGNVADIYVGRDGVFENADRKVISSVKYTDGSVVIIGDEIIPPSITPESANFDKNNPSDITVNMTPNNNTFKGIVGLTEGKDYSVSGNTVKIFGSYLSSLDLGTAKLVFDFGITDNPSIEITIEDSKPIETDFYISIGKVSGKTGDVVTVPVEIGNISKVKSVGTCNFYISYDDTLLEAVSVTAGDIIVNAPINFSSRIRQGSISCLYLDNTIGDELITEDGVMLTITFKIIGEDSVETPITFEESGAFGDGNMAKIDNVKKIDGSVKIN